MVVADTQEALQREGPELLQLSSPYWMTWGGKIRVECTIHHP